MTIYPHSPQHVEKLRALPPITVRDTRYVLVPEIDRRRTPCLRCVFEHNERGCFEAKLEAVRLGVGDCVDNRGIYALITDTPPQR